MNQDNKTSNQMRALTISREYGSGGGKLQPAWPATWDGN